MRVYVTNIEMSSPNHQESTEVVDEFTRKITLTWDKDTRDKIAAARMRTKKILYNAAIDFHGIYLIREDQIALLQDATTKGHADLQKIRDDYIETIKTKYDYDGHDIVLPQLHATLALFSLDLGDMVAGGAYQQVLNVIRAKVYRTVFERLTEVLASKKGLTDTTRKSMLKMIENLRAINILNDVDIETQLNNIKQKIEDSLLNDLRDEMVKALETTDTRGAQIKV